VLAITLALSEITSPGASTSGAPGELFFPAT
jgi:hypothetical protein